MAGFVASEEVPEETYDFAPYGGRGVIPEPSTDAMKRFRSDMSAIYASMSGEADNSANEDRSVAEQLQWLSDQLSRDDTGTTTAVLSAIAELTLIPLPDLQALPYRLQQGFMGYVTGTFLIGRRTIGTFV